MSAHVLAAGDAPCSVGEESTKKGEHEVGEGAGRLLGSESDTGI